MPSTPCWTRLATYPPPRTLPVLMQVSGAYLAQVDAGAILDPLTSSGAVARRGVTIMCTGTASGNDFLR